MPRKSSLERLDYQTISLSNNSPENQARFAPYWPHKLSKVKRLLRREQDEVVRRGVVVRVGKELILNVPAYLGWLSSYSRYVANYKIAPNSEAHKDKRFGAQRVAAEG